MRATLTPALFAAIALVGTPCCLPASSSYVPSARVCGRVLDRKDQSPVAYANVVVLGTKLGAQTDERGQFCLEGVPAGSQRIRILAMGADPVTVSLDAGIGTGNWFQVTMPFQKLVRSRMSDECAAAESVGVEVPPGSTDLTCEIHPAATLFHVGDKPSFHVSITNHGATPLNLVSALDGSAEGWRYPIISVAIDGPAGGFIVRPGVRCGNMNTLALQDFVTLAPGQSFEPLAEGWWPYSLNQPFRRPGRYRVTFCYSTVQPDVRLWTGDWCCGGSLSEHMSQLFRRVPMVELTATTECSVIAR